MKSALLSKPKVPQRHRKLRKSLKTFTGCWTCRQRKVKCDEQRPECAACVRGSRLCQGYDQKLHWGHIQTPNNFSGIITMDHGKTGTSTETALRRFAGGPILGLPTLTADDIEQAIENVDVQKSDVTGLFGSFNVSLGTTGLTYHPQTSRLPSTPLEWSEASPTDDYDNSRHLSISPPSDLDDVLPEPIHQSIATSGLYEAHARSELEDHAVQLNDVDFLRGLTGHAQQFFCGQEEAINKAAWDAASEETSSSIGIPSRDSHRQTDVPRSTSAIMAPPDTSSTMHVESTFSTSPRLLRCDSNPSMANSPLCQEMLHHYITWVANIMMPVLLPQDNPWLTIFVPHAVSNGHASPGRDALFHALISVASFNRSRLAYSQCHEEAASLHQRRAMKHLRQALTAHRDVSSQPLEDLNIIACMLTMTTIEVMSGGSGSWKIHLRGATKFICSTGGRRHWLKRVGASAILCQMHDCLNAVMATSTGPVDDSDAAEDADTLHQLNSGLEKQMAKQCLQKHSTQLFDNEDVSENRLLEASYCLDYTYGISPDTLEVISRTNRLDSRLAALSHKAQLPFSERQEMAELEGQFQTLVERGRGPESPSDARPCRRMNLARLRSVISQEAMEHHCWAFQYAASIYFNRVTSSHRKTACAEQQRLVGRTFDHLETIESLKIGGDSAVTLWPAFVAACEAATPPLRHRAIIWFARALQLGIGNIRTAKEIALEVWRRVDREAFERGETDASSRFALSSGLFNTASGSGWHQRSIPRLDWRQVMRELGADIMLT